MKNDVTDWRRQVEVRDSGIHGRGLFACKAISKNAVIGRFEGAPTTRNGQHVLWLEADDGNWRGIRVTNELRYVNHSPSPNAEVWDDALVAVRSIRAGEEITFHYGDDWA